MYSNPSKLFEVPRIAPPPATDRSRYHRCVVSELDTADDDLARTVSLHDRGRSVCGSCAIDCLHGACDGGADCPAESVGIVAFAARVAYGADVTFCLGVRIVYASFAVLRTLTSRNLSAPLNAASPKSRFAEKLPGGDFQKEVQGRPNL
jgi:hypothetical protein